MKRRSRGAVLVSALLIGLTAVPWSSADAPSFASLSFSIAAAARSRPGLGAGPIVAQAARGAAQRVDERVWTCDGAHCGRHGGPIAVASPPAGRVLVVAQDGTAAFGTIGDAVAAVEDGDRIEVRPGTYRERVTVQQRDHHRGDRGPRSGRHHLAHDPGRAAHGR